MAKPIILNLQPEQLPALVAAMDIALRAASGYSVRTCPQRDVISTHWGEFNALLVRVKQLEGQRELGMGQLAKGRKYIHIGVSEAVHDRLYAYAMQRGGGKIRVGQLSAILERALTQYLDSQAWGERPPVVEEAA